MGEDERKEGPENVPRHVAVIMDGNGRWAQQRGLPRLLGHRAGVENIRRVVQACAHHGVETLTIYAFSTENWGRPADEVSGLLSLLEEALAHETANLHANGVRIRHLGELDGLPGSLADSIRASIALTARNEKITLNVAFNYGGRNEIVRAVRRMLQQGLSAEDVTEETLAGFLDTAGQRDPDLVIRTAGEMRLSNYLIWQTAYAEYYSTPAFWPDFDEGELLKALQAFSRRKRRFGRL